MRLHKFTTNRGDVIHIDLDKIHTLEPTGTYCTIHCGGYQWVVRDSFESVLVAMDPARLSEVEVPAPTMAARLNEIAIDALRPHNDGRVDRLEELTKLEIEFKRRHGYAAIFHSWTLEYIERRRREIITRRV